MVVLLFRSIGNNHEAYLFKVVLFIFIEEYKC